MNPSSDDLKDKLNQLSGPEITVLCPHCHELVHPVAVYDLVDDDGHRDWSHDECSNCGNTI